MSVCVCVLLLLVVVASKKDRCNFLLRKKIRLGKKEREADREHIFASVRGKLHNNRGKRKRVSSLFLLALSDDGNGDLPTTINITWRFYIKIMYHLYINYVDKFADEDTTTIPLQ